MSNSNLDDIPDRLRKIMHFKSMNTSQFSEAVNVKRSSITHVLNGRNRASLEMVTKIVSRFPEIDLKWLVTGKGSMDVNTANDRNTDTILTTANETNIEKKSSNEVCKESEKIDRIVVFYTNGKFTSYKEKAG